MIARSLLVAALAGAAALGAALPAHAMDLGGSAAIARWATAPAVDGVDVTASRQLADAPRYEPGARVFRYLGAVGVPASEASYGRYVYKAGGVTGFGGVSAWAIATRVTGGRLVLRVTGDGTTTFRLRVDGRPTPVRVLPRGGYRTYDLTVRLPSRRAHEVVLDLPGAGTNFLGALKPKRGRLSPPRTDFGPRTILMGDSWAQAVPTKVPFEGFVQRMGHDLGLADVWASGIGGTGYWNPGMVTTFGDRLESDVLRFRPATVIVAGGANDFGASEAEFDAAARSLFSRIRTALPRARIIAVGPFVPAGNLWPQLLSRDAALKAAVEASGGAYVSALQWITGNGSTVAPKGDGGNADVYIGEEDHPNLRGYAYIGDRLADAIRALR